MVQLLGAPIHNIVKFNLSLTPNKRIIWQKVENLHATILKNNNFRFSATERSP